MIRKELVDEVSKTNPQELASVLTFEWDEEKVRKLMYLLADHDIKERFGISIDEMLKEMEKYDE